MKVAENISSFLAEDCKKLFNIHRLNFPNDLSTCLGFNYFSRLLKLFQSEELCEARVFRDQGVAQGFYLTYVLSERKKIRKKVLRIKLWSVLLNPTGLIRYFLLSRKTTEKAIEKQLRSQMIGIVPLEKEVVYLYLIESNLHSGIQGVGTSLHNDLVRQTNRRCNYIQLSVATINDRAVRFYLNKGWQILSVNPESYKMIYALHKLT